MDQGIEFQEPLNSYGHTEKGNAGFTLPIQIDALDTNLLTDSSIRLGIRIDDAWAPRNVFLFGRTDDRSQVPVPIAIETDLDVWLSTDNSEGHLSTPIRLVRSGRQIRRVLLVISTGPNDNDGTDDDIELEIRGSNGTELFREQFNNNTPQADLEKSSANYYVRDVKTPIPICRDAESFCGSLEMTHGIRSGCLSSASIPPVSRTGTGLRLVRAL